MTPDPELSSLTTALAEMTRRVTQLAERWVGTDADALAQGLYEVERTLNEALRRLDRISRTTSP